MLNTLGENQIAAQLQTLQKDTERVLVVQLETLNMDPAYLNRSVNEGFSGGERKKSEILQLSVLEVRSLGFP